MRSRGAFRFRNPLFGADDSVTHTSLHRRVLCALIAGGALVLIGADIAFSALLPNVLAISGNGLVTRMDPNSNTTIFSVPHPNTQIFSDIARTKDGRYVAYRNDRADANPTLFQINPATGDINSIASSADASPTMYALTSLENGFYFGFGDARFGAPPYFYQSRFLRINPTTLTYQVVPITNSFTGSSGVSFGVSGMATAPNGDIYGWGSGSDIAGGLTSRLVRIDLSNNTAISIGDGMRNLSTGVTFIDIAFSFDGRLFGFTDVNGGLNGEPILPTSIYELDLQTGLPMFVSQPGAIFTGLRGVEFVPEPNLLPLITMGTPTLLARRRRKPALLNRR